MSLKRRPTTIQKKSNFVVGTWSIYGGLTRSSHHQHLEKHWKNRISDAVAVVPQSKLVQITTEIGNLIKFRNTI